MHFSPLVCQQNIVKQFCIPTVRDLPGYGSTSSAVGDNSSRFFGDAVGSSVVDVVPHRRLIEQVYKVSGLIQL